MVYSSTRVTRPPPQVFGSVFMPKEQAEKPDSIVSFRFPIFIDYNNDLM
jgi:hypothetical protein